MPELRQDPLSGAWVVVATERAERPHTFDKAAGAGGGRKQCPFCAGHEHETPPEIEADRESGSPDSPGWSLRVVHNKFPAFTPEAAVERPRGHLYELLPATGSHEVIVHTPDHTHHLADMRPAEIVPIFKAYQRRLIANYESEFVESVLVIVNYGRDAGASIDHPHSQVFAAPMLLPILEDELEIAAGHFREQGHCLYCELLEEELNKGQLVIAENHSCVALAPYASKYPYEVWLMPKVHSHRFELETEEVLLSAAELLKAVLRSMAKQLNDPGYNLWLHTSPTDAAADSYHWHFEIAPKVSVQAGFEMGSGVMINIVTPRVAAPFLAEGIE